MDMKNLGLQILNCVIISIIALQAELFNSNGYVKYVTQSDGSMDLLMQLSELKSKSITYVFNNKKIRKIISIQRKKEVINSTVQKLREKIVRWRKFTKTTMINQDSDAFKRMTEETKTEIMEWSKKQFMQEEQASSMSSSDSVAEVEGKNVKFEKDEEEYKVETAPATMKISAEASMQI
jgi:hypothetical protein